MNQGATLSSGIWWDDQIRARTIDDWTKTTNYKLLCDVPTSAQLIFSCQIAIVSDLNVDAHQAVVVACISFLLGIEQCDDVGGRALQEARGQRARRPLHQVPHPAHRAGFRH